MSKDRTKLMEREVGKPSGRALPRIYALPHSHSAPPKIEGFSRSKVREHLEDAKWQESSVTNADALSSIADRIRANRRQGLTKRLSIDDL